MSNATSEKGSAKGGVRKRKGVRHNSTKTKRRKGVRHNSELIGITQRTIERFMATLESAFIRPSARTPHIPALDEVAELPFLQADPEDLRTRLAGLARQPLMHAYVRDDGWRWEAVWHASNADEAATGEDEPTDRSNGSDD